MKRIIIAILFLIFLIRLPFLPYKKPEDKSSTKNNEVRLVVEDGQNTGGLYVSEGTEYTKKYLYNNNIENIPYDEISLSGNTMYNEVALFKNGIPTPPFVVYGDFSPGVVNVAGEGHTYNLLTLKVDRWYPEKGSIELWDTYFWENNHLGMILLAFIIATCMYIFLNLNKLRENKAFRRRRNALNKDSFYFEE